jgi:hypothetical protein
VIIQSGAIAIKLAITGTLELEKYPNTLGSGRSVQVHKFGSDSGCTITPSADALLKTTKIIHITPRVKTNTTPTNLPSAWLEIMHIKE